MNAYDPESLRGASAKELMTTYLDARWHRNLEITLAAGGAIVVGLSGWSLWFSLIPGFIAFAAYGHQIQMNLTLSEAERRVEDELSQRSDPR